MSIQTILSNILVIAFIIESCLEIRLYPYLRRILIENQGPAPLLARVRRIVRIDNFWNWASWILIILMLVAPGDWSFLVICVITLLETWVVMEMNGLKRQLK